MKIRVLHILNSLGFGGAEKWLLHMMNHVDKQLFHIDIMIHDKREGYAEEIKKLGANVIVCPYSINLWTYGKLFKGVLRRYGPYDIVHSHLAMAGFHAFWAHQEGIAIRLVQKHTDDDSELLQSNYPRKIGVKVSKYLISHYATAGVAVSRTAGKGFGSQWEQDQRWRIMYLGIDLAQFRNDIDCRRLRRELGFSRNALILGHVGRFTKEKNHGFLLDVFVKTLELEPRAVMLLVGDGPLRPEIEIKAARLGLADKVLLTGWRRDVPLLMKGAMDIFVLPSLFEGLPLVLMETQAAGLPSIISKAITEEADVIRPLIKRLSLTTTPKIWAKTIIQTTNEKREIDQDQALRVMEHSHFNIASGYNSLFKLYKSLYSKLYLS